MDRKETRQVLAKGKTGVKAMYAVDAFSPDDEARAYAKKLFKGVASGWGDEPTTLEECARLTATTPRSFKRIVSGETKNPAKFFGRLRKGYLDWCARKAAELLSDIEAEKARYGNVRIGDLDQEVLSLVARIDAARAVHVEGAKGR